MREIAVDLADRSYTVTVGVGVAERVPEIVARDSPHRVAVLVDGGVPAQFRRRLELRLQRQGLDCALLELPAGEAAKTWELAGDVHRRLLRLGLDRRSAVICLGGGAAGDLAGFVAATYMRGIALHQIPTTLLAMVDSAIGGKTAVNLPGAKNAVGAFHQPRSVVADLEHLATLPRREYVASLAEVVKYGVILDAQLFQLVDDNAGALLDGDTALLEEVVARCVNIKADVVSRDEREAGERALLNYGHTAGHAIEMAAQGALLHGECVALGMRVAAELSVARQAPAQAARDRQNALLQALGLPARAEVSAEEVLVHAAHDKKSVGGAVRWVLMDAIGQGSWGCEVEPENVRPALASVCAATAPLS